MRRFGRLVSIGCSLLITLMALGVSIFAVVSQKNLQFNLGLRFNPTILCKLELKNNESNNFVTIFNNVEQNVNEFYIDNYSGNTINLRELSGEVFYFKLTNLNQATGANAISAKLQAGESIGQSEEVAKNATSGEFSITLPAGGLGTSISIKIEETPDAIFSVLGYGYITEGTYYTYDATNTSSANTSAAIPTQPIEIALGAAPPAIWDFSNLIIEGKIYRGIERWMTWSAVYNLILENKSNKSYNLNIKAEIAENGFCYGELDYKLDAENFIDVPLNSLGLTDITNTALNINSSLSISLRFYYQSAYYLRGTDEPSSAFRSQKVTINFLADNKQLFSIKTIPIYSWV